MATTPSPSPTPTTAHPADLLPMLLRAFGNAFQSLLTSSPLVAIVVVLGVLTAGTSVVRQIIHGGHRRDPVRRFSRTDKAAILTLAGHRCEHHSLLFGRCQATDKLEADHVHPWARGGQTNVANGQALCKRHNQAKRATVPFNRQLRALERRRTAYYPPGVPTQVSRHAPAPERRTRRSRTGTQQAG